MQGKIIVLSASSGAGKTTLLHAVYDYFKAKYPLRRVITYTTRAARSEEVDGIDYYFISSEEFEQKKNNGFFLEWSCAYGAYYGSPRALLNDCKQGISFIIVLDRVGVQQLLSICPEVLVTIWLTVEPQKLEARLQHRGSETIESYNARMQLAKQEGEQEGQNPIFSYHVQNDDFDKAFSSLIEIIARELELIR